MSCSDDFINLGDMTHRPSIVHQNFAHPFRVEHEKFAVQQQFACVLELERALEVLLCEGIAMSVQCSTPATSSGEHINLPW